MIPDTFDSSVAIDAAEKVAGVPVTFQQGVFVPVGSGIQIIPPVSPPPIQ